MEFILTVAADLCSFPSVLLVFLSRAVVFLFYRVVVRASLRGKNAGRELIFWCWVCFVPPIGRVWFPQQPEREEREVDNKRKPTLRESHSSDCVATLRAREETHQKR